MGACHSQRRDKDGGRPGSMAVVAKVEEGSPWQHYETVDTGISPRRSGLAASSSSSSTASGPGAVATQKTKPRSNDVLLQVFRVKEKETGVTAIARQIFLSPRRNSPEHTRKIVEEVMALSHPNIVQVQRAYLSECSVHLIMAHLRGAVRLSEYLAQLRAPSLGLLTSICKQIASAVNYLHSCGFVHAFLSPDSFMVLPVNTTGSAPAEGGGVKGGRSAQYAVATPPRVLLIDFGLEWKIGRNVGLFVALEHAPYTSPEVAKALTTLSLRNRAVGNATTASDVFSIGAIFFFVFTGRDLFEGPNTTAILDKVKSVEVGLDLFEEGQRGQYVPKSAAATIVTMTCLDPTPRISLKAALAHEFLSDDSAVFSDGDSTAATEEILSNFRKYHQSTVMRKLLLATVNFRLESEHSNRIAAQFEAMDTDQSGRISLDEFRDAFKKMGASVKQLERMFTSLDIDGSGELDYKEFLTAATSLGEVTMMDRMQRAFEMWDVDGNGYIDADDVRAACEGLYKDRDVEKIFEELELSLEDGRICYAEFIKISQLPATPQLGTGYNMKQSWTRIKAEDPFQTYEQLDAPALGEGMTGKVYQIKNKFTGHIYAGKRVRVGRGAESKVQLMNEIHVMIDMDHPNIVRLHEVFESKTSLYLVMELCTGGELYDDLINREQYTERDAAKLFFQMVASIAYVHRRGIAHRDLKLENFIFQSKSENSPLKLIDFGLSKRVGTGVHKMASVVGTAYYMAPEVVDRRSQFRVGKGKYYTKQCDMWSLGVLLYMMLSGQPPFDGRDNAEIMEAVKAGQYSTFEIRGVSDLAQDLLSRLLEMDPDERLTAADALKHPWFDIRNEVGDEDAAARPLPNIVPHISKFNRMCRLKRACMSLVAFDMSDKDVEEMRQTFIKFDTDNSGSLSLSEFREAMAGKLAEDEVEEVFQAIDFDNSGAIAYSEFLSATIHTSHLPKKDKLFPIFSRLDVDGNGTLEAADLRRICQNLYSDEELSRMIAAVDRNGDGKIGYEEFLEMMESPES